MKEIVVYPYKMGSASAKTLAEALDVWRVYGNRNFRPTPNHIVMNWGNGDAPAWDGKGFLFLNRPENVMNSINKIRAFKMFRQGGVRIPTYTADPETAHQWIGDGKWVVCRAHIEGKDGEGLVLAKTAKEIIDARLYTMYVPIDREFRVYTFRDKYLNSCEKKRKVISKADPDIRTEGRGWVFCQDPPSVPEEAKVQAALATRALGLDFSGADVVLGKDGKCYVLEVNTAPGIYGTTVSLLRDKLLALAAA